MIDARMEPRTWSKGRWGLTVALVMIGQLGLILWLSGPEPLPRARIHGPSIFYLSRAQTAEAPDVDDPTLFALPNRHGFSGPAWLKFKELERPPLDLSNEPVSLTQEISQLGGALVEFIRTNAVGSFVVVTHGEPQTDAREIYPPQLAPPGSTLRIEGGLAGRVLATPLNLPSWPANFILTNSEVEVTVAANGHVFSPVLVKSCGSKEADGAAVRLAGAARFEPVPARAAGDSPFPASSQSWGKLVFQWFTVAPRDTNRPAAATP